MGSRQAFVAAVAGTAHAFDDRIDAIAIAFRIREPLQHHGSDPLADYDAVGTVVKSSTPSMGRKRVSLRERKIGERIVVAVGGSNQGQVAQLSLQLSGGDFHCRQRRRTSRVDGEVASHQVQAIGNASSKDVAEKTGEGIFRPFRKLLVKRANDFLTFFRCERIHMRQVVHQHGAKNVIHAQIERSTDAKDDGCFLSWEFAFMIPRVF